MKIIKYRNLKNKEQLLPTMHQALWYPLDYRKLDEIAEIDHRLKGPVGFCGVIKDQLAGFVGVMDTPTRTISGTQKVGCIWAVVTNPTYARQGVFKALMSCAHNYFKDQGYPFSFLFTTHTLIAHSMYVKLGYEEVMPANPIPSAYKLTEGNGFANDRSSSKLDWSLINEIYEKSVADKTGFVLRQNNFGEVFIARDRIDEQKSIQIEDGYALITESEGIVRVRELNADNEKYYRDILEMIESLAERAVMDVMVVDERLLQEYTSRGYMIQPDTYNAFMVKGLDDKTLPEVYGDSFYIRNLDSF